jgi:S-adenosylmethionine:tRNA ribosyltransferase-isomerase
LKTADFDYHLPPELIAQVPIEPRDASRLLVLYRETGEIEHDQFRHIGNYLQPGDVLVVNRSRVIPARLAAHKTATGGKVELLLLERLERGVWKALVGGKGLKTGVRLELEDGRQAEVRQELEGALRVIRFDEPLGEDLEALGQVPLPPYIHEQLEDGERYQTVYAKEPGSAAAPTAGLHFTPELMKDLEGRGVQFAEVLLHIGLDTFAPVTEELAEEHHIHSEWCRLSADTAEKLNKAKRDGHRIVAVGTTSVRVLESAARSAREGEVVGTWEGPTDLFILPGYSFNVVDAMLTNFHLPRSTLLMLVSAFAGRQHILDAYAEAIEQRYRFYSFGDAMFIG